MTDKPANPKIYVLYKGREILRGGKLGYTICSIGPDGKPGPERYFAARKAPPFHSVGIYMMEVVPDEQAGGKGLFERAFYASTARWHEAWHDQKEAAQWEAASDALVASYNAAKLNKSKAIKADQFEKLLAPLAQIYQKLPSMQKTAFKILVINRIEKGWDVSDVRRLNLED